MEDISMSAKDRLQAAVAMIVLIGAVWGGLSYFAKAEDLRLVEQRLDQKIVFDQVMDTKKLMAVIEERNRSCHSINEWDQRDRDEYKRLQDNLEELKKRRDILLMKK